MQTRNILFVGCGQLGAKVATELARDHNVWAITRSPHILPDKVHGIPADLTRSEPFSHRLPDRLDDIFIILSPATYSDEAYRQVYVQGTQYALAQLKMAGLQPRQVFFVSSTSVYHQDDGAWVNEQSPTQPDGFSGKRLLEAEQLVQNCGWPATVIRFSGIYGGQRARLLEQVRRGDINPSPTGPLTNRIHQADCVGMLLHLWSLKNQGHALANSYLGSDNEPVRLYDIAKWINGKVPCKAPDGPVSNSRRAGSKRCSNQRIRQAGYRFQYPTFREGYAEMLSDD